MINVTYGDEYTMAARQYNIQPNQRLAEFAQQRRDQMMEGLTGAARQFAEGAQARYQAFIDSDFMRRVNAAKHKVQSLWTDDRITYLQEVWKIQNAPPTMMNYTMAEPTLRKLYHQQRCDGYSGKYVDDQPDAIGDTHNVYRQVNDGVIHFTDDGDWYAASYSSTFDDEGEALYLQDKEAILDSWQVVREAIAAGIDPSSMWDNPL